MSDGDETIELQGTRVPRAARAYGNEREVGRGIADSGVVRDEIFLTTKVTHDEASADEVELTPEERAEIDALPKDVRTADPPWAPDWDA
jgi:diketogulonate reductase-like aldo/keto reductase